MINRLAKILAIALVSCFVFYACKMVTKVEQNQSTALLLQSNSKEETGNTKSPLDKKNEIKEIEQSTSEIAGNNENVTYIRGTVGDDGDVTYEAALDGVNVYSRLQVLPEKEGKVYLTFKVVLPKILLDNNWRVVVQPTLHLPNDRKRQLEPIAITGELASLMQQRDYWQYEKVLSRLQKTDAIKAQELEQKLFKRIVTHQKMEVTKLDSVQDKGNLVVYHYVQEVNTQGILSGEPLLVTLKGNILAIDRSEYKLPLRDTLEYNIASMLSFVDQSPRFIYNITSRFKRVNVNHNIQFAVGKTLVDSTLGKNTEELATLRTVMGDMITSNEYYVDSIILNSTSSPDGRFGYNQELSERRAKSLTRYIGSYYGNGIDSLLLIRNNGENWSKLTQILNTDPKIKEREKIMTGIDRYKDPDEREYYLRRYCKTDFGYIENTIYPKLRTVEVEYYLRRKKMIQDTIYSTQLDERYMAGLDLLNQRKYEDAIEYLEAYDCKNTAIAYLSMGYNNSALDVLNKIHQDHETLYLLSIVWIRNGDLDKASKYFKQACEIAPYLKFRINVDPEISKLRDYESSN